jgi:hypothetical protein
VVEERLFGGGLRVVGLVFWSCRVVEIECGVRLVDCSWIGQGEEGGRAGQRGGEDVAGCGRDGREKEGVQ